MSSSNHDKRHPDTGDYHDEYLQIDFAGYRIVAGGQEIHLTAKEFRILQELILAYDRAIPYQDIYDKVWQQPYLDSNANNIHFMVNQLRHKIEPDPSNPVYIINIPQYGYRFESTNR